MRKKATCGATNRRGLPCGCKPLKKGGRCRFHGGCSTGPRTARGKDKARENLVKARAALAGPEHEEARRARARQGWVNRRKRAARANLIRTAMQIGMSADTIRALFGAR